CSTSTLTAPSPSSAKNLNFSPNSSPPSTPSAAAPPTSPNPSTSLRTARPSSATNSLLPTTSHPTPRAAPKITATNCRRRTVLLPLLLSRRGLGRGGPLTSAKITNCQLPITNYK